MSEENLDDTLKYVENGGGTWSAKVIKRGKTKRTTITSKSGIKTIEINNFENEYDVISTSKNVIQALNEIDRLDLNNKDLHTYETADTHISDETHSNEISIKKLLSNNLTEDDKRNE